MNKKIYIHTLGCPKNDADSDGMANILTNDGFEITFEPEDADIILINTCCFVNDAKEESVEAILSACEMKKENPSLKVAVCGCLAQRYFSELKDEIPEVDYFIGTGEIAKINKILASNEKININDILENFQNTSSSENASEETNDFSKIDPATLLKLQKIMSLLNSKKTNSKDETLLLALKPYMRDSKKEKIDQYIKLLHIINMFEKFQEMGGNINDFL